MKFRLDRKYFKICLYAFVTVAALILFNRILQASEDVWKSVMGGVSFVLRLVSPFIMAVLFAYFLNPAVAGIERLLGKIFKKPSFAKGRQLCALILVYVAVVAAIAVSLSFVIPNIIRNINDLLHNWTDYQKSLLDYYNGFLETYPILGSREVQDFLGKQLSDIGRGMKISVGDITSAVMTVFSSIFSFLIALILSFYLLNERENIVGSFAGLLRARLGEKRSASAMDFLKAVDRVFGRYISAKLLLAFIMFILSLAVFTLLGVRYAVLMSALVGITSLVPYIGPFLGAAPPILISLLDSPEKAIYVGVAIIAINAVDNYFLEPHIFGESVGLSPFWILFSIILGGGLFGLWGILFAVPVAAVVKLLVVGYVRRRQARRRERKENGPGSA